MIYIFYVLMFTGFDLRNNFNKALKYYTLCFIKMANTFY